MNRPSPPSAETLAGMVKDARHRTLALVADLSDDQLMGPRLPTVNPLLWELGHLAWFQEKWVLRSGGRERSLREDSDFLYDSTAVPHDARWELRLPSLCRTLQYLIEVRDRVLERLSLREPQSEEIYFNLLSIFHEDMHDEAFTYTRQRLGYSRPKLPAGGGGEPHADGPPPGDAYVPGGEFLLGGSRHEPFVFDNEKWAHPVTLAPFRIARAPVTQAEFAAFVGDRGYARREWWSEEGWRWRESENADLPLYWRRERGGFLRRNFDRWVELEACLPMHHLNWHEAQAFCRWAGRRLPSEAEWEMAACGGVSREEKRRYPWGDDPPAPEHANLDWRSLGCIGVEALPAGDSPLGCRQMIGNVWEWTNSPFVPYPEFAADPYRDYSQPWFYTHQVLRGGSWATTSRMIRGSWRNFYRPERRDIWAGFRTCASI